MVTNFHLPESTLIMLVSAFAGYKNTMNAYHQAVAEQYRFFSYGDAMFINRNPLAPQEAQRCSRQQRHDPNNQNQVSYQRGCRNHTKLTIPNHHKQN